MMLSLCVLLGIETMLMMDARLGYTYDVGSKHPNWTEVAHSTEDRPVECSVTKVSLLYCLLSSEHWFHL